MTRWVVLLRSNHATANGPPSGLPSSGDWRLITCAVLAVVFWLPTSASLAQTKPAMQHRQRSIDGFIAEASLRFAIPERWITAVIEQESGGDPAVVSLKGARGLMQLMPGTWDGLRSRHHLGRDPFDPHDNILAGTANLRAMLDQYGTVAGMLAAYNAGPSRVDDLLRHGRPLPSETRAYVALVLQRISSSVARETDGFDPHDPKAAPVFVPSFPFEATPGLPTKRSEAAARSPGMDVGEASDVGARTVTARSRSGATAPNTAQGPRKDDTPTGGHTRAAPTSDGLFVRRSGSEGRR